MPEQYKSTTELDRAPVIEPGHTFGTVTEKISAIVLTRPASNGWFIGFGIAFMMTMMMLFAIGYLFLKGIGIWGVTIPIGWGFAIVNFVWWIGIGHAGTLISAILLLLRQKSWRNSINRFAEAMTFFAVACAGHFPRYPRRPSLARVLALSLFPTPWASGRNSAARSCGTCSRSPPTPRSRRCSGSSASSPTSRLLRDRTDNKALKIDLRHALHRLARIGNRHWHRYETRLPPARRPGHAAGAQRAHRRQLRLRDVGIVPGWHTTIFPPYFVAGAIYSGFAMVLMLAIPIRKIYGLEDFITERHLQNSAKVMLATGLIVAYGYAIEAFMGWYSGDRYDAFTIWNRLHGPYAIPYYMLLICNIFHSASSSGLSKLRTSPIALFCRFRRDSCRNVARAFHHCGGQPAVATSSRPPGACITPRAGTG
jgi:hypothetical protein